jgi:hypothetical protein
MKKQTAVEWLWNLSQTKELEASDFEQAIAMEKEQMGYTKEDVLKAGEIGEINHHDYKHIVKLLDEAKQINQSNP